MKSPEWSSYSKLVDFGSGMPPNKIAFYLNGDERAVNSLKLKLYVHDLQHLDDAHKKLLSCAEILTNHALERDLNCQFSQVIILGEEAVLNGPNFKVTLSKNEWKNHSNLGYELVFEVSVMKGVAA